MLWSSNNSSKCSLFRKSFNPVPYQRQAKIYSGYNSTYLENANNKPQEPNQRLRLPKTPLFQLIMIATLLSFIKNT